MFYINTKNKTFTQDFFENSFDLHIVNDYFSSSLLINDGKNYICKLGSWVVYEIIKKDYIKCQQKFLKR